MVLPACLKGDVIMWNMKKLTGMAMALVLGLSLSAGIAAAEPSGPDPNDRPQYTDNEPGAPLLEWPPEAQKGPSAFP